MNLATTVKPAPGQAAALLPGGRLFIPACIAAGLALRAALIFLVPLTQTSDFLWYFERASSIASGAGYAEDGVLTAFWPVGWPGLMGLVFMVTGASPLVAQLLNLVLSGVILVLTARLAPRLLGDRVAGGIAVAILAFYPNQIAYVPILATELFYAVLLLAGVGFLTRGRAIAAGIVFGIATLTKAQSLLLPAFILACVVLMAPVRLRPLIRAACVATVAAMLVVAPWTWRNHTVLHAFIPVSTNGGWTLLSGNNPEANGDYSPDTVLAEGLTHLPSDQVAMDRTARERAIAWIKQNPGQFAALLPRKMIRLWVPDGEAEWFYQRGYAAYERDWFWFRTARWINQGYYAVIMLLALPSMVRVVRRRSEVPPWAVSGLALVAYFSAISLVFSGQSRFHAALMPFLAMYAAWTISRLLARRMGTSTRAAA